MEKKERKGTRQGILANFQFYIDEKSNELFEGLTLNISSDSCSFITEIILKEGQTITMTRHALPDFRGQKAKVIWVKKRSRYVEAGSQIYLSEPQKKWPLTDLTKESAHALV
ncbi:MAG: hypothetical protein ABSA46_09905 [Thermodesulfovibrionales bacterium]